jgi:hypothetical protein
MALFQKRNSMTKLADVVTVLRKRGALLTDKRVVAQAAFDAAISRRQEHLLSGDLDDGTVNERLQHAVDVATSSAIGIDDALAAIAAQTNAAEVQLAAANLTNDRRLASELLATQIATWLAVSRELADAQAAIGWRFETAQQAVFIRDCASQIEAAHSLTSRDLHASIAGILAGNLDVAFARPTPAVVDVAPMLPAPIPEKLVQVFSLNALSWSTADGVLHQIEKWRDCELPEQAAERALRHNKAGPMSHPRRGELRGHGGGHPDPAWCFDCDHEPSVALPDIDPMFERIDRGPAYKMHVATG